MEFVIEILKAVVLGIIQGITEWLPISSTGHMILADAFLNLNQPKEFMDMFYVVIQLGSILAVVVLYFQKLNPFSPPSPAPSGSPPSSSGSKYWLRCCPSASSACWSTTGSPSTFTPQLLSPPR